MKNFLGVVPCSLFCRVAASLLCLLLYSCGTIEEFEFAERQFALGQYEQCIYNLKIGLLKDPDNDYYRCLKKAAQRRAAEQDYETALNLLEEKKLLEAEKLLERVSDYDPDHIGAQRKLSEIRRTKSQIKETLQTAEDYIDQGKWDDAYLALGRILPYQNDFPTIQPAFEQSREGSFAMHLAKGQNNFETGDYFSAVEEFKIALSRNPTSRLCLEMKVKSNNYRNAQILTRQGDEFMEGNEFAKAHQKYEEALKIVPSFKPALEGGQKAKNAWVEEMYITGQKLLEQGKTEKARAFEALHLLEQAFALSPQAKDVEVWLTKAKKTCANHLFEEGYSFLQEPKFLRVGLASYFLEYAARLDPSREGLPDLLVKSSNLARLKFQRNIFVDGTALTQNLVRLLQATGHRYFVFTTATVSEYRQTLNEQGIPPDFPLRFLELKIALDLHEVRSGEGKRETLLSRYFRGLREEKDPLWEPCETQLKVEKNKHRQLFDAYRDTLKEYEASRIALQETEHRKKALELELSHFQSLQSAMENWEYSLREDMLHAHEIAGRFAETLQKDIEKIQERLQKIVLAYREYQGETDSLYARVAELERNLEEAEANIEKCQKYLDSQPRIRQVEDAVDYQISRSKVYLFCKGRLSARLKGPSKEIAEFVHEIAKNYEALRVIDAHESDVNDQHNMAPDFPSEKALTAEMEAKLVNGIYGKMLLFLNDYPLTLFEEGIKHDSPEDMERLVEFVELDANAHPAEYARASQILREFAESYKK